MAEARLQVIAGGAVPQEPLATDPWQFQAACIDAFVASWRARGFSPVTIDNDIGLLERTLAALGRPAWEVTPEDIDRVVGDLAVKGRATSTRREYVQIFKGSTGSCRPARRPRSRPRSVSGWSVRSTSSTPPGMSATTPRPWCRRRHRSGWRSSSTS
ncbi:hypothetical protein [Streptomyces canus]|uniref:hypothetical protein n=1 Tax=Streptomyces canus TaxID=58343 RepID=UPI002E33FE55|nr:hypothetical protein [Streptomyces canus]